MDEQIAWLIERRRPEGNQYLQTAMHGWNWTDDVNQANKYPDQQSAQIIADSMHEFFPVFVCAHSWPEGW